MNIPLPRAGHWAKEAVGKAPPRPELPATAERDVFVSRPTKQKKVPTDERAKDLVWLKDQLLDEQSPARAITVDPQPRRWHPAIRPLRIWLEDCVKDYESALRQNEIFEKRLAKSRSHSFTPNLGIHKVHAHDPILGKTHNAVAVRVSRFAYKRALAILNALAYAAETRGFEVELPTDRSRLNFTMEGMRLEIAVVERLDKITNHGRVDKIFGLPEVNAVPTGLLCINFGHFGESKLAEESGGAPLEQLLHRVFERAYRKLVAFREDVRQKELTRKNQEATRVIWEEIQRQRKIQEELKAAEDKKREELTQQVGKWDLACRIRGFVDAVDCKIGGGTGGSSEFTKYHSEWRAWALRIAEEIDPIHEVVKRFSVEESPTSPRI